MIEKDINELLVGDALTHHIIPISKPIKVNK